MPDYISKNKPEWEELEALVKRARRSKRSLRRMTSEELSRLDVLYRRTTVHLAQVATRTRDAALLEPFTDTGGGLLPAGDTFAFDNETPRFRSVCSNWPMA